MTGVQTCALPICRICGSFCFESEIYAKKDKRRRKEKIAGICLRNIAMVNNWNLVDISVPYISGEHRYAGKTDGLRKMAESKCLWRERECPFYLVFIL